MSDTIEARQESPAPKVTPTEYRKGTAFEIDRVRQLSMKGVPLKRSGHFKLQPTDEEVEIVVSIVADWVPGYFGLHVCDPSGKIVVDRDEWLKVTAEDLQERPDLRIEVTYAIPKMKDLSFKLMYKPLDPDA